MSGKRRRSLGARVHSLAGIGIALLVVAFAAGGCRESDPLAEVEALQKSGHWEESVEKLRRLVDEAPTDARLHLEYGKALMAIGDATRAIWPLRRASEDEAFVEEAGVLLSMALLASGNAEDAIGAASTVLARDANNSRALFARSRALLAEKREEEALADAEVLVAIEPDDPQARLLQLGLLVMLKRIDAAGVAIDAARPVFEEIAEKRPEEGARYCVLEALFVWEKGDATAGEKRLDGCLEHFPDEPLAVREAVAQFDRAGRSERGTSILRDALERDPKQPEHRLALATRLRDAGDAAAAEGLLREGTSLLEGPGPWLALHDHYVFTEDHAAARRAMEQALALQADPPAALRIAYADDLILSGDLEKAEQEAAKIPAPGVHLVRGRILLARGDAVAAVAELEEGIRLWPDNPSARWLAGQAAERAFDLPRAIAHYRESVRTDAGRTPSARELAELYAAMGSGEDALDFAMRNLDANPLDPDAALLLIRLSRRFDTPAGRVMGLDALARMPGERDQWLAQQALERALAEGDAAGIAWLERAVGSFGVDRIECLRVMTELERRAGRSKSAESRLKRLLRDHTDSVELLLLLADLETASAESPLIVRDLLERARKAAPSDPRIAIRLARSLAESGQIASAAETYDSIPESAEEFGEAVMASIEVRRSLDAKGGDRPLDDAEVERRLEAVLAREPRNAKAAFELARRLSDREPGSERAVALARTAASLGAGAPAQALLGRLLVERGEYASALPVLDGVISSLPASGPAQYSLAVAHARLGHEAEAKSAFERALAAGGLTSAQRQHAEQAVKGHDAAAMAAGRTF